MIAANAYPGLDGGDGGPFPDSNYAAKPVPPEALGPNPTPQEQDAYDAKTVVYERDIRAWMVAVFSLVRGYVSWNYANGGLEDPPLEKMPHAWLLCARTAVALADRYAPTAPLDVRNEAAVRCCGWIRDTDPAFSKIDTESTSANEFRPATAGALRGSGAMALLSPWKVRRARAI